LQKPLSKPSNAWQQASSDASKRQGVASVSRKRQPFTDAYLSTHKNPHLRFKGCDKNP